MSSRSPSFAPDDRFLERECVSKAGHTFSTTCLTCQGVASDNRRHPGALSHDFNDKPSTQIHAQFCHPLSLLHGRAPLPLLRVFNAVGDRLRLTLRAVLYIPLGESRDGAKLPTWTQLDVRYS